jgi:hypothetical protein
VNTVKNRVGGVLSCVLNGFIEATGAGLIPGKYASAGDFAGCLARVVLNGKNGCADKRGREYFTD